MRRDYQRFSIDVLGEHLLRSLDLDPVYVALYKCGLPRKELYRWLLAYWCGVYHVGAASYLAEYEGRHFWAAMMKAAANTSPTPFGERWPRGHERRHWRGIAALRAVRTLWNRYGDYPEEMVKYIAQPGIGRVQTFEAVAKRAREHPLFGPWIAFKVCDMVERLGIASVSFDHANVFMFNSPKDAALMVWRQRNGLKETAKPKHEDAATNGVVRGLEQRFKDFMAPPRYERRIGLQEIETILCKWKSHLSGHYPLLYDIQEIREGLKPWAACSEIAKSLLHNMPQGLVRFPRGVVS